MGRKANNIEKLIRMEASKNGDRLFPNNVGMAYLGKVRHLGNGSVLIENAQPVRYGLCKGSSDLIGWTTIEITPEMVGKKIAVFTAIEVKTTDSLRKEQKDFLNLVEQSGGIADVARSTDDYKTTINKQQ
jgi:hypothetical protein